MGRAVSPQLVVVEWIHKNRHLPQPDRARVTPYWVNVTLEGDEISRLGESTPEGDIATLAFIGYTDKGSLVCRSVSFIRAALGDCSFVAIRGEQ